MQGICSDDKGRVRRTDFPTAKGNPEHKRYGTLHRVYCTAPFGGTPQQNRLPRKSAVGGWNGFGGGCFRCNALRLCCAEACLWTVDGRCFGRCRGTSRCVSL